MVGQCIGSLFCHSKRLPIDRMSDTADSISDTTDSTTGADGCDQFVDDGRDETLLMLKGTELEAVSATDVNLTDPEYTMQMGDTAEQMNRFFRCQYDSNMLSKFSQSLKIGYTDLEYVSDRERAIDVEVLKNQLDVVQGENGELNQFTCSDAAHRCRMPGPIGPVEDKRQLMTPTSIFFIITLNLMKKTRNNAIDENIGHSDSEIDSADLGEGLEGTIIGIIMPQVHCLAFPDGPDVIVLNSTQFLTGTFSFVRVSSVVKLEGKRHWQTQNKPKHKESRTQTQNQPINYELHDYFYSSTLLNRSA